MSRRRLKKVQRSGILPARIVKDTPCLITKDMLARCKKELKEEKPLQEVVTEYLRKNPEDQLLHDNLIAVLDTDIPLYGKALTAIN